MSLEFVRRMRARTAHRRRQIPYQVRQSRRFNRRIRRLERGISGREIKLHDEADSGTLAGAGVVHLLNGISQGDSSLQREGLKSNLLSIQLRSVFTKSVNQDHDIIRIMLFLDQRNQGVLPTPGDVLETANYLAFKEHDETNRFKILYDKTFALNETSDATNKGAFVKYYKRFSNPIIMRYQGTGSAQADVSANSLYILLIASAATTTYATNVRLRFSE